MEINGMETTREKTTKTGTIKCAAKTKSGTPCRNKAKYGPFCGVHKNKVIVPTEVKDPGPYVPAESQQDFITDQENLRSTLERYGVAIVPGVLTSEECAAMKSGAWDFFEKVTTQLETPLKRGDPLTWSTIKELYPNRGMLFQHWGIGHAQYLWDLRQNPKVVDVFAKFWSVKPEELLVSFDGASFGLPPEKTKIGWHRRDWYHFDQRLSYPDFRCVQAWVTANDVNPGDATLTVIEGSNSQREFFVHKKNLWEQDRDWAKMDSDQISWFEQRGCVKRDITCKAGDMVLWDSRTAHAGKGPIRGRKKENQRVVGYVCYQPRKLATKSDLRKKQKLFKELRTTSHWPAKPKAFGKNPHTYGKPLPDVPAPTDPVLSSLGLKLAGF